MWCVARFGTICTILKSEKHPWRSANFSTKINTPLWVFFTLFKLYKWYQIAQRITYRNDPASFWYVFPPSLGILMFLICHVIKGQITDRFDTISLFPPNLVHMSIVHRNFNMILQKIGITNSDRHHKMRQNNGHYKVKT